MNSFWLKRLLKRRKRRKEKPKETLRMVITRVDGREVERRPIGFFVIPYEEPWWWRAAKRVKIWEDENGNIIRDIFITEGGE